MTCEPPWSDHEAIVIWNFLLLRNSVIHLFPLTSPEVTSVPSLVLPSVFVLIGLVILLLGTAYIMRLRKKPRVEVADFDFHPHLTSSSSSQWDQPDAITRLTDSLKVFFSKTRHRALTYIQTRSDSVSERSSVSSQDQDGGSTMSESPLNVNTETDRKQFYQSLWEVSCMFFIWRCVCEFVCF